MTPLNKEVEITALFVLLWETKIVKLSTEKTNPT